MFGLYQFPEETDEVGIFPFNLDDSELKEMYRQPVPDDYAIVVTLFYADDAGAAKANDLLRELLAEQHVTSVPRFEISGDRITYFSVQELPWLLEGIMSPEQQAWLFNGVYIQCGFWRTSMANDQWLMRGISTAMTWADTRIKLFSDYRVIDSTPIAFEEQGFDDQTPLILARNFRLVVNDIFREGVGVWCSDLVHARNEILIKIRARLAGVDPQKEWERFQASMQSYFLHRHFIVK